MFGEKKRKKWSQKISLGITRSKENYAAFAIFFGIDFNLLRLANYNAKQTFGDKNQC